MVDFHEIFSSYSSAPNRSTGPNIRAGGKEFFFSNHKGVQISNSTSQRLSLHAGFVMCVMIPPILFNIWPMKRAYTHREENDIPRV